MAVETEKKTTEGKANVQRKLTGMAQRKGEGFPQPHVESLDLPPEPNLILAL
jgi:hypothetical protein